MSKLFNTEKLEMYNDIISIFVENKISLKAAFENFPSYLQKDDDKNAFKIKNRSSCLFPLICCGIKYNY